ncbi:MAG: SUMF1/EgtB/PvdO family nonheme iron enzyme [Candidatus Competibacter sp.]|nr:SUMF1/EgtB/PvdO family nonheme iron enzyme [Candidatus Competibacter sp.]
MRYPLLAGWRHPVRRSGKVLRGGSWNNHRDNARCAYRDEDDPDFRAGHDGFRVVLLSAHVLPPLLLVPSSRRDGAPGYPSRFVPAMRADPRQRVGPPRRRKNNSAS